MLRLRNARSLAQATGGLYNQTHVQYPHNVGSTVEKPDEIQSMA